VAAGIGPYVFGAGGDVVSNATLSTTTAFGGRVRVAFLDVPAGSHTASVTFTGTGGAETKTATIVTAGNSATVRRFYGRQDWDLPELTTSGGPSAANANSR